MMMMSATAFKQRDNVPDYMLQLFADKEHQFDNVRNYASYHQQEEDDSSTFNLATVQRLMFNISTLPAEEQLQLAQLKLWTRVRSSSPNHLGSVDSFKL